MTVKPTASQQKTAGLAQFQRAPLARAIRQTLAISVATVALAGTAPVFAAACTAPVGGVVNCPGDASDPDYPDGIDQAVDDLFLTIGGPDDTPTVTGAPIGVSATDGVTAPDGSSGTDATGTATVVNYADITTAGAEIFTGFYFGEGIATSAPEGVAATNHGIISISATATHMGSSFGGAVVAGVAAVASYGDVVIDNSGTVAATATATHSGDYAARLMVRAVGVLTRGGGDAAVTNSGTLTVVADAPAYSYAGATGIVIYADGDVAVTNSGTLTATAHTARERAYATGVDIPAFASVGDVAVTNSGTLTAAADATTGFSAGAQGIFVYTGGDGAVTNSGTLTATADATADYSASARASGIIVAADGDVAVTNSGTLTAAADAAADYYVYAGATGIVVFADGDVAVTNSGTLTTVADSTGGYYTRATGIDVRYAGGDVAVTNSGTLTAAADTTRGSYADATAVNIDVVHGDVAVTNSGAITATAAALGTASAWGVSARTRFSAGDVAVDNSGAITATATALVTASARGVSVPTGYGDAAVTNSGTLAVTAAASDRADAHGIYAYARTYAYAYAAPGDVTVTNSGAISVAAAAQGSAAPRARAVGIAAAGNTVTVTNAGDITVEASAGDVGTASARGVVIDAVTEGTLVNTGMITADVAIASVGASADYIYNGGTLNGAIDTGDGDDTLVNASADTWHATGISSFGAGDDAIANTATGRIAMTDATIDMGSFAVAGNTFDNAGLIEAVGSNTINMGAGNPNPFMNTGTISFLDGDTNDSLHVIGNFGGAGSVDFDVDGATATADALRITGDVVGGPTKLNAALLSLPADLNAGFEVPVYVTGTSAPGDFVMGELWVAPDSFLTFDADIVSSVDTTNATPDVHAIGVNVAGLSDVGVLASSLSPAAQTLFHTAVGTLHQRQGALRDRPLEHFAVWVRGFGSKGDMDPDGIQSNVDFEQEVQGFEAGVDFALPSNLRIGLLAGQANTDIDLGSQRGKADIDGDTLGAYLTWMAHNGFYADLSYRVMDLDGDMRNADVKMEVDGDAKGWSLETGYTLKTASGVEVEPQFQFTKLEVDLDDLANSQGKFALDDGDSTQARLGAMVRKTYTAGNGARLTPYLSVNAINELEGDNHYAVNNSFRGKSDMRGTSLLVEPGLNVRMGRVVVNAGLNHQDGGAFDEVLGGQVGVRSQW